jgi:hypothetical protein
MNVENILLKDILNNNTLYEVYEDENGELQYILDESGEKIRICEINELEWDTNFNNVDNICSFIGKGKTPKYVDDSSIQVIKSGQARGMYEFDLSTKYYTDEDKLSYADDRILKYGDLVINTTGVGTVGRVTAYVLKEGYHTPDSHMCIMRTKENISFRYLLLNFVGIGFKNLEKMAEGIGGQIELGIGKIKNILVHIPKANEYNSREYSSCEFQESIAKNIEEKFGKISKLIHFHNTSIDLLNGSIGIYLDGVFSNKTNFLLNDFIEEYSTKNTNNELDLVYAVTNAKGIIPESEKNRIIDSSADKSNYKIIEKYNFAFNPSRVNIGSIGMLKRDEKGVVSPIYDVFTINEDKINPYYFEYYLKSNIFKNSVNQYFLNAVRPKLDFDDLKKFKISVVFDKNINKNKKLQENEIENIKNTIDNKKFKIKIHNASLILLEKQKDEIIKIIFGDNK